MKIFCPYLVEPQSQRIPVSNKKPLSDVKLHSINQQWPFCKNTNYNNRTINKLWRIKFN